MVYSQNMHNVCSGSWKDLEVMDFRKVMQQVLRCWYMFPPGSNVIIPMFLPVHCSTVCPWVFISLHKLLSMRESMAWKYDLLILIIPTGIISWKKNQESIVYFDWDFDR